MSSPSSTFLPFSPTPSSSPPPLLSLPPPSTTSSLSSFDAPIDSPTSLSLFILRCREEIGHHARVLLATKLTNVNDEQIRQMYALRSTPHSVHRTRGDDDMQQCKYKLRTAN